MTIATRTRQIFGATGLVVIIAVATLTANHSWGSYHWARTSNPFTLKVGDNVDADWDVFLDDAITDWNASAVLNVTEVPGGANPRNCRPTSGRIEVCNSRYGNNGWLGIAQIWVTGTHITQAVTKVNDSYFNTPTYDTPAWRRLVMCQEVGHDFGLDHQDETFANANLGTCMDYTNDPDGGPGGASTNDPSNEHPNQHDYAQLNSIYQHLDGTTTVGQLTTRGAAASQLDRGQFGQLVRSTNGGRTQLFVLELGNGHRVFTHVIWAE
jgi:hypothetical protein